MLHVDKAKMQRKVILFPGESAVKEYTVMRLSWLKSFYCGSFALVLC